MDFDQLFFYFIIYSFLGFILETIYRSIISKRLVYPGFLFGPYCPIYGFGLIALLIFLVPLKGGLWLFLPAAFILTSILEYVTSYLLEKLLGIRLWDYRQNKMNINGRISLKFSIYWTFLAYLFIYFIHPVFYVMPKYLASIGVLVWLKYLLIPILFVDFVFSVNKAIFTRKEISALDLILIEMEDLKDNAGEKIESLKADYEELLGKLLKVNKNIFIYRISSTKFPKVIKSIKETGKNMKIIKWLKEDK
ncbi:MAG: putative ABC transporter permease [Firmicutes bacterium]|nr:putative ABC transporter permease [Bacillota bacterium]